MTEEKKTKKTVKNEVKKTSDLKETKTKPVTKKEVAKESKGKKAISKKEPQIDSRKSLKDSLKKDKKRSRLDRKSKAYKNAFLKIEKNKEYAINEAVDLLSQISTTKFDGSVEIHLNLNIDTKNPEHQIRGSVSLPAGLGKEKRVAVVCKDDHQDEAKRAGADLVGGTELIEKIAKGDINFDVLVATPDVMGELAKAGKILGPKGLMPNSKDNTVTTNLKSTIEDIKKGRAEYRTDSYGIVHSVVGKTSFNREKLLENIETFLKEIHSVKPASIKSNYVKSIYLTTTMGPSIKVKE